MEKRVGISKGIEKIIEPQARSVPEVTRWSFKERFSVYTGGDGGTEN